MCREPTPRNGSILQRVCIEIEGRFDVPSFAAEARRLPSHHVTIRVPLHDGGWTGGVCSYIQVILQSTTVSSQALPSQPEIRFP